MVNWPLILNFVRQDLKDKYSGSVLGSLWTFLNPLSNILIFAFVFSQVMGARLEMFGAEFSRYGYSVYLIAGILFWNSFSTTIMRVANVFEDKRGILGKVGLPLITLPIYVVITEGVVFLISFGFFALFLVYIGIPFHVEMLLIPLIYVLQQFLAYSIGFVLAVFSVFIRDIKELVALTLQLAFWLTPIVYVVNIIPQQYAFVFDFNPVYWIITAVRATIIEGASPNSMPLVLIMLVATVVLGFGIHLVRRLERDIRDAL